MNMPAELTALSLDITSARAYEQIPHILATNGIFIFENIESPEELVQFCTRLGAIIPHRDADERGLTRIIHRDTAEQGAGYQAFSSAHLSLHTDGSSIPEPASLVVLWCSQPAPEGGQSLLVDGKQIYQILVKEFPHVLTTLTTPKSALFAGSHTPVYSSIFSKQVNGNMHIRFRYDSLGYYIAPVCSVLPVFLALLEQHTYAFMLGQHQGYVIQNGRWLHGRSAFQGDRELYRVLVQTTSDTTTGKQIVPGFDPSL